MPPVMRTLALTAALALALGAVGIARAGAIPAAGADAAARSAPAAGRQAIWLDPSDRGHSLVVAGDASGLTLRDLAGRRLQAVTGVQPARIDLRAGFPTPAGARVLVAVAEGGREGGAKLYLMDPERRTLAFWADVPLDLARPHEVCLAKQGAGFQLVVGGADGQMRQLRVEAGADGAAKLTEDKRFAIMGAPAGCVGDDAEGRVYVAETGRGVWRFDLSDPSAGGIAAQAPVLPDLDGVTLVREQGETWLVGSSQSDQAVAVWGLDGDLTYWYGAFMVSEGTEAGVRDLAASGRLVGGFADGLVVAQKAGVKLVDWRTVRAALGL
jgi:3-phytase